MHATAMPYGRFFSLTLNNGVPPLYFKYRIRERIRERGKRRQIAVSDNVESYIVDKIVLDR